MRSPWLSPVATAVLVATRSAQLAVRPETVRFIASFVSCDVGTVQLVHHQFRFCTTCQVAGYHSCPSVVQYNDQHCVCRRCAAVLDSAGKAVWAEMGVLVHWSCWCGERGRECGFHQLGGTNDCASFQRNWDQRRYTFPPTRLTLGMGIGAATVADMVLDL